MDFSDSHSYYIERLKEEYLKHKKLIIGFDFDDTVFRYKTPYNLNYIISLLRVCKSVDFTLCLWTCCPEPSSLKYKVEICKHLGIEPDYVNESPLFPGTTKPYFNILLDDRAGLDSSYYILLSTLQQLQLYEN